MRRDASRGSFLMCPFCVRAASSTVTTPSAGGTSRGSGAGAIVDAAEVRLVAADGCPEVLPVVERMLSLRPALPGASDGPGTEAAEEEEAERPVLYPCPNAGLPPTGRHR